MEYKLEIENDDWEPGKYKVVKNASCGGVMLITTLIKRGLTKTEAETLLKEMENN